MELCASQKRHLIKVSILTGQCCKRCSHFLSVLFNHLNMNRGFCVAPAPLGVNSVLFVIAEHQTCLKCTVMTPAI